MPAPTGRSSCSRRGAGFRSTNIATSLDRNLQFILDSQREDGSWLYALESPAEAFIDHFHTCFVLKNLHKLNRVLASAAVVRAIEKGWDFYRRALFHDDETPKSFAIEPRTQLARVEMYNFAEAITLGTLAQGLNSRSLRAGATADSPGHPRLPARGWSFRDAHLPGRPPPHDAVSPLATGPDVPGAHEHASGAASRQ